MTTNLLTGHRPRIREVRHRLEEGGQRSATAVHAAVRRVPLPTGVRRWGYQTLPWRSGTLEVPIERILLGGQNRLDAREFAVAAEDPLWASTRLVDGPHVRFLLEHGDRSPSDAEILATDYAQLARRCISLSGQFFSAQDDAGIVAVARRFLGHARGDLDDPVRLPHQSAPGDPVRLAPIRASDCFQVVDGHHRIAAAWVRGQRVVAARVKRVPVRTPLQEVLDAMSWIGGERELYQPIDAPELKRSWATVRRCTDRLTLMQAVLAYLELTPEETSYLDVACCYGWFVARLGELGFRAEGVERDPLGQQVAAMAYGVPTERVVVGDAVDFLRATTRRWDVVSCFSLLHHFVLGRGSADAAELVRLLDRVTGRVLFLDTGQEHEAWFARSLAGWDAARVAQFLTEHGSFDRVIDLGPDQDAVGPYAQNYGRHLFACVKDA